MRGSFSLELAELKQEIKLLGSMVEKAFHETLMAISDQNIAKLNEIINNDEYVNELELAINEKATLMIAKQQPVASDLRKIIVSLKVSSDLERMGDLTVDMAKAAKRVNESIDLVDYKSQLKDMAEIASKMMSEVLQAYQEANVLEAQQIATLDDKVDQAYSHFIQSLIKVEIHENKETEHITQLAFIARYIERIADYCTNIAEWIIYEVSGKRFDLN